MSIDPETASVTCARCRREVRKKIAKPESENPRAPLVCSGIMKAGCDRIVNARKKNAPPTIGTIETGRFVPKLCTTPGCAGGCGLEHESVKPSSPFTP